jgi:Mce-associated membrane protein
VAQAQSTSTGTVTEAGLESADGTQARVLVAVSVTTSIAGKPDEKSRAWRMRLYVDKVGDHHKISNVEFVP